MSKVDKIYINIYINIYIILLYINKMQTFQTNKKTYNYTLNGIKYEIFYASSGGNISIEIINTSNPLFESYHAKFSQEGIRKISSLFNQMKTLEQYDKLFDKIFSNQKFSLIKSQKEITIKIVINLDIFGDQTFELSIPKVQIDNEKKLDFILNKYTEQQKINNGLYITVSELNDKVKKQEKKIELLEKNNNELTGRVIKLEKIINEIKEKEQKKLNEILKAINIKFDEIKQIKESDTQKLSSNIIYNLNQFNIVINRLKKYFNKDNITFNLLYRTTRDGDKIQNFYNKCGNKKNTLILIKTKNNYIFGGFTTQTWENYKMDKKDDNAFCFSLDKNKIYETVKGSYSIFFYPGKIFGFFWFIDIKESCLVNGGSDHTPWSNGYYKGITNLNFELNNGCENFGITEMETFQIS